MRLINTENLTLHEFFDAKIPKYAILSHTWGAEEISFQEWSMLEAIKNPDSDSLYALNVSARSDAWAAKREKKSGYKKILDFCRLCRKHEYDWAWVDTCCIDKSSSAELSEAINSMFSWYKNSERCFAYLEDMCDESHKIYELPAYDAPESSRELIESNDDEVLDLNRNDIYLRLGFASSRWFKRGWTLQELLAPSRVHFYDQEWRFIGTRYQLSRILTNITKISGLILRGQFSTNFAYIYPVAERFSWAAHRETSRAEDTAYCLLGIFQIHMPLLYGEGGPNAFRRLQEELLRRSTDHSIFIWKVKGTQGPFDVHGPVLAPSPSAFEESGKNLRWDQQRVLPKKAYTLTNTGLQVELLVQANDLCPICNKCRVALLDCWTSDVPIRRLGIYLRSDDGLGSTGNFERKHCDTVATLSPGESAEVESSPSPFRRMYLRTQGSIESYEEVD